MKRKLINYEVFTEMRKNSLSVAAKELAEAEEHLARSVKINGLKLNSFTESSVIYESNDGTFLHANYAITNDKINFNNVEQLVIDQDSEKNESRTIIANMLEAILGDNDVEANTCFDKYMDLAKVRHKRHAADYVENVRHAPKKEKKAPSKFRKLNSSKVGNRHLKEWVKLANNVNGYCTLMENSHVIDKTEVKEDGSSVAVPTAKARNEGKMLKMTYANMMKTDCKVLRENAHRLVNDQKFCQAVADVKRYNNLSDDNNLEESIDKLVTSFPGVLYLTQEELAGVIGQALENAGVSNYGDDTCKFMSEGILRVAHNAYGDRVERILKLANQEIKEGAEDAYLDFQAIVSSFFKVLDESTTLELKMFEDLYNASVDVRRAATESENEVVRNEASDFISDLEDILNGRQMPTLQLASEVADWLDELAEANVPGASETWNVVKKPHQTWTGDHPQMAKNAKVPAISGSYTGDWGDPAPMIGQDSNGWNHGEEARKHSWGNKGEYPNITNPYTPKPFGDYTMKGEKGVDKETESGLGMHQGDTFPELQNPYVPKAVMPHQKVDDTAQGRVD